MDNLNNPSKLGLAILTIPNRLINQNIPKYPLKTYLTLYSTRHSSWRRALVTAVR